MSYKVLAAKSKTLSAKYPTVKTKEDIAWEEGPFAWIRKKASGTKGRIGRDLLAFLLEADDFNSTPKGVALIVNNKTIRVRTSLAWKVGKFKFQQFRDTNYDFVFCLGLYPLSS